MKSYNRNEYSVLNRTIRNGNQISIESLPAVKQSTWLGNVSSRSGDGHKPNPQTFERLVDTKQNGRYYAGYSKSPSYVESVGPLYSAVPPDIDMTFHNNVYNTALGRLYEQTRGKLDLSVDLFQSRQTREMVGKSLKVLRDFRGAYGRAKDRPSKAAADIHLQYIYGIKPTLKTLYELVSLFQKGAINGDLKLRARASEQSERNVSWNAIGDVKLLSRAKELRSERVEIGAQFFVPPSILQNFASMTSLNPASIAWELLKFSFVVDWVYDIGGYLRNLESCLLYANDFRQGYVTSSILISGVTDTYGSYNDGTLKREIGLSGSYRYTRKLRTVLLSSPVPRAPRFKVDLGSQRILNAVALTRQLIKI